MTTTKEQLGRIILEATCSGPHARLPHEDGKALALECLRLKGVISQVHSWAVCGAIAPVEDMMQGLPEIVEITKP